MRTLIIPVLLAMCLAACSCPPVRDMERLPGYDMSTPENALEYFRQALMEDDARHQFLVFSEDLKRYLEEKEKQTLSLQNYILVRDDLKRDIEDEVGTLENIKIGAARYSHADPNVAEVDLISRTRRETVIMVQQIEYDVFPTEEGEIGEFLDARQELVSIDDGVLHLKIPLKHLPEDKDAEIYRIKYFREWKIRDLKKSPFTDKMDEWLSKQEKKAPDPQP